MFAREFSKASTSWTNSSWNSFMPFGNATGGRAKMTTLLPEVHQIRAALARSPDGLNLTWTGGIGPFVIQRSTNVVAGTWEEFQSDVKPPVHLMPDNKLGFYRVVGQ
jgi:hypothetical protein